MAEKKPEKTEHEYVIPLRSRYQHVARYKKTPKAVRTIKEFLVRHMKIYDRDLNKIKIDRHLNEFLWSRGIKNPVYKIKIKAKKEGDIVRVELVDYPDRIKFKKLREEKVSKEAVEALEKKKTLKERMQETMKGKKEESGDKNKDGIDDKKEENEKKESVKEASEKIEKDMAKKEKHTSKTPPRRAEKAKEKVYNIQGRGR